ncbi:MAG TPA: hypothetical protein PKA51_09085, partial [Kiritimatiellia bacterium]|nr:hypothetical protein [Kiritimatiellia bacterium]
MNNVKEHGCSSASARRMSDRTLPLTERLLHCEAVCLLSIWLALGTLSAQAVLLIDHDFSASNHGWGDRDTGEMDVNWTGAGGFGNPAMSG